VSTQISEQPVAAVQQIADPGPLGLAGFAMTTFVLSVFNTNLVNSKLDAAVLPLALFYGGLAQLLAGMWEFRKGNTFGATAFASFGAFWLSFYWLITYDAAHLTTPAGDAHKAVGVFLLAWAIFTAYMTIAAMRTSGAVLAVFVALTIAFILLAIGKFATGSTATDFTKIGGWVGLVTAALAWYASFAGVTNATWARSVLPTWPMTTPVALTRGPVR
jgi:uncharacterized protein